MQIVTFGEIMARLAMPGHLRFRQALPGSFDVTFAGAEANVAASLSMLGASTKFVSVLPNHAIADACVDSLRCRGINTDSIIRSSEGRLGLYMLESGANQRPSVVIYDREYSSIGLTDAEAYDWENIFKNTNWFHVTGITPAVSALAAEATLAAVQIAQQMGVTVSCDLNFRKKLWQWKTGIAPRELAEETMRGILPFVDLVIANEEDCQDVLGIRAGESEVSAGNLQIERYPDVARQVVSQFENISRVAITLRESISASHNNWGAMLYDSQSDQACFAPEQEGAYQPYQIRNIVDRVGGGDSFAAGLIFALNTPEYQASAEAIRFATAASCLAHSISGDFNFSTRSEIESLMNGSGAGRVLR